MKLIGKVHVSKYPEHEILCIPTSWRPIIRHLLEVFLHSVRVSHGILENPAQGIVVKVNFINAASSGKVVTIEIPSKKNSAHSFFLVIFRQCTLFMFFKQIYCLAFSKTKSKYLLSTMLGRIHSVFNKSGIWTRMGPLRLIFKEP